MENNQPEAADKPISFILQKIRSGSMLPRDLEKEDRQRCVESLFCEGFSEVQISQELQRSEKTIRRDLSEIRRRNAISPSVEQAKELIGEMQQQARLQISRLTRIAISPDSSEEEKINAEAVAWKIRDEFTSRLQTLGYLPLKPTEYVLTQQSDEKSFADVEQTLADVRSAAQEYGTLNPKLEGEMAGLQAKLEKAKLAWQAAQLLEQQKQQSNQEETKNE
jgi:transposase